MHDWLLRDIKFDWQTGRVVVALEDTNLIVRLLMADGVEELQAPRENEWGPSVCVNEAFPIEQLPSGLLHLKIEMQSGDVIQITAKRFELMESGAT